MIVVLFILYMPMRLLLALFPWIPIPAFRDFVKYPEIVEKWAVWSVRILFYAVMVWITYQFIGWWSAIWVSGTFTLVVLINLVVMWYGVRKFRENGTETERKTDQVL